MSGEKKVVWQRMRFFCENCGNPVTVTRSGEGRFGGTCSRCRTVYCKTLKGTRQVETVSRMPEGKSVTVR